MLIIRYDVDYNNFRMSTLAFKLVLEHLVHNKLILLKQILKIRTIQQPHMCIPRLKTN